jgi:choline kinase
MSIDSPVILMDADVFYDPELVDILFSTKHNNIFLLDRNFEPGDEPVKLCVAQDKIIEFRKQLSTTIKYEVIGESVGFFRFSKEVFRILHIQAEKYLKASAVNEPYEEVIRDVLLENPGLFSYADITGIPWIEIDFPDDIEKAKLLLG